MYVHYLDGLGYDKIMTNLMYSRNSIYTQQFYILGNAVIKQSEVLFISDGKAITSIVTEDTDTVVLPKSAVHVIKSYALKGCNFKRLVVPYGVSVELENFALYGSSDLKEFLSFSRDVNYGSDSLPASVERRCY